MLGRAIVLVREDQLSLAIGRRGQNVRLASKLSGWDIEIMTQEELAESIDRAVQGFSEIDGIEVELAERLVEEGFLSYDDLTIIEPDALMEMGGMTAEQVDHVVQQAETRAEEAEAAATEARRLKREQDRQAAIEANQAAKDAALAEKNEAEKAEAEKAEAQDEQVEPGDESASTTETEEVAEDEASDDTASDDTGTDEVVAAAEDASEENKTEVPASPPDGGSE